MFSRKKQSAIVIAIAALIVGALVVSMVGGLANVGAEPPEREDSTEGEPLKSVPEDSEVHDLARRDADDPLAIGPTDAPVLMIAYVDFQTAASGQFTRETLPVLQEEFVENDMLRVEFRNFPIYGPESDNAARAAWAAGQQDTFWEFNAAAFAVDAHQNSGKYSEEGVRELAEEAGVPDLEQFAMDMESEEAGESVGRDAEEGQELDAPSAPAFLINGHPMIGAQPVDEFRTVIEQLHASSPRT